MRFIGLTGGISSGKSTVRAMLEEHGARVLDADAVYHELIAASDGQPSELGRAIGERFPGVLRDDGTIDRAELGARVFSDAGERRALEAMAHPAVATEVARQTQALRESGCPLLIYDVPLLYERRLEAGMDGVIVVWVPREVQVERLMARDAISSAEAMARLAAQLPIDEKRRQCTWLIDNSGELEATRAQVDALWKQLGS